MIRCAIIDDEPLARQLLTRFISRVPNLEVAGEFSNPLKAIDSLLKNPVDVIFLDVQMPQLSGIDFLKAFTKKTQVIITSAHAEYALDGFNLDVVDYLLKPFDFNRFLKSVNKLASRTETPISRPQAQVQSEFLFVKDGSKLVKISFDSLLFIEGLGDYVKLVLKGKTVTSLQTMKKLESELPDYFIRIHNSYIISIKAIDSIQHNNVQIGDRLLPIGITYKKTFLEKIQNDQN